MFEYIVLIAALATAFDNPPRQFSSIPNISNRTVGSENVAIEEVPYQVSIHYNGFFQCGGVIISEEWIISAASCFSNEPDKLTIRAGSTKCYDGGSIHKVDNIIINPKWNFPPAYHSDIALLHVADGFVFDKTRQPVPMFDIDEESEPGAKAVISGWGDWPNGPLQFLQSVELNVMSKKQCYEFYEGNIDIEHHICVSHPDGNKDACLGDHGGPLTINGRLAGIISLQRYCGNGGPNVPSLHTEVAIYRSWIKNVTGI